MKTFKILGYIQMNKRCTAYSKPITKERDHMAVTEKMEEVKVILKLTKGSQTIPNCKADATAEQLHTMGTAVGELHQEGVEKVMKITESLLTIA